MELPKLELLGNFQTGKFPNWNLGSSFLDADDASGFLDASSGQGPTTLSFFVKYKIHCVVSSCTPNKKQILSKSHFSSAGTLMPETRNQNSHFHFPNLYSWAVNLKLPSLITCIDQVCLSCLNYCTAGMCEYVCAPAIRWMWIYSTGRLRALRPLLG